MSQFAAAAVYQNQPNQAPILPAYAALQTSGNGMLDMPIGAASMGNDLSNLLPEGYSVMHELSGSTAAVSGVEPHD